MFLYSAKNKVTYEIPCIVGAYHAPFLVADTWHMVRFNLADVLSLLPWLQRASVGRSAVHEPIGRGLYIIVTSQQSVIINDCRVEWKVLLQEGLLTPRVLHNEPQSFNLGYCKHLYRPGEEQFTVSSPLQNGIDSLLRCHVGVVLVRVADKHLAHAREIYARKECHY